MLLLTTLPRVLVVGVTIKYRPHSYSPYGACVCRLEPLDWQQLAQAESYDGGFDQNRADDHCNPHRRATAGVRSLPCRGRTDCFDTYNKFDDLGLIDVMPNGLAF